MSWLLKKKVGLLYLSEALALELQPAVHPQAVAELLDVDRATRKPITRWCAAAGSATPAARAARRRAPVPSAARTGCGPASPRRRPLAMGGKVISNHLGAFHW